MIALNEILVADDFTAASEDALRHASDLARLFNAKLHILHVADNYFLKPVIADVHALEARARRRLHDRLREIGRTGIETTGVLITSDDPAESIVDYAKRKPIGLIVMGTHGRHAIERMLMGSVAEDVVRTASCPVLTVRPGQRAKVPSETGALAMSA